MKHSRAIFGGLTAAVFFAVATGSLAATVVASTLWAMVLALVSPTTFRRLGSVKFWLITVALTLVSGLLIGKTDLEVLGVPMSSRGITAGVLMLLRGFIMITTVVFWSSQVTREGMIGFFSRIRAPRLGVSLHQALLTLPDLKGRMQARLKEQGRLSPRKLLRFWETVLVESVLMAEQYAADPAGLSGPAEPADLSAVSHSLTDPAPGKHPEGDQSAAPRSRGAGPKFKGGAHDDEA